MKDKWIVGFAGIPLPRCILGQEWEIRKSHAEREPGFDVFFLPGELRIENGRSTTQCT